MPVAVVSPNHARYPLYAGVDVGGTNIKLGIVDDEGRALAQTSFPTDEASDAADGIRRIDLALAELMASVALQVSDLKAIGLGTPGTMDIPRGMILEPPNMPRWRFFPVRDELSRLTGLPVAYANDAAAAAWGEYWVGSGRLHNSIVMFTLGTGVGGGIIVDGKSIDGEHSAGSECGHILVDTSDSARLCSCGMKGHLEAYASASALVDRTDELLQQDNHSILHTWLKRGSKLNGKLIWQAANEGDSLALEVIDRTADYLALGIVTLAQIIDPAAFILGGAMNFGGETSSVGHRFIERVRVQSRRQMFPLQADQLIVIYASLGGDAGFVGAAAVARSEFGNHSLAQ